MTKQEDRDDDQEAAAPTRRGRPTVDVPTSIVSARVPVPTHDRLIEIAVKRRTSVSSLVARLIRKGLSR